MEMSLGTINIDIGHAAGFVALFLAVGSVFFEVSKIKVNPISFLLRWIGKKMFEPFDVRLDAVEKKIDQNEIDRIRWEILAFANSCRNGKRHTKDEFSHIIQQNDKYHNILNAYNMKNGQIDADYEYIEGLYKRCQEQNDFL